MVSSSKPSFSGQNTVSFIIPTLGLVAQSVEQRIENVGERINSAGERINSPLPY
jgi:hypothetical protein